MACSLEPNLDPELIIVARGGMVAKDHGESIKGKRAEIIDASRSESTAPFPARVLRPSGQVNSRPEV